MDDVESKFLETESLQSLVRFRYIDMCNLFGPNLEYSNLVFSNTFGLYPKSTSVKYLYLSRRFLDDNAEILAAFLHKSYCV